MFRLLLLAIACLAAQVQPTGAQDAHGAPEATGLPTLFDPDRHIAVADVEPGMTGHGLTVFAGTAIERFDIRVVAKLGLTQQLGGEIVLIECLDERLIESGPVQGMSGSPIYLTGADGRDRLLGAFAFGWEFSKRPLIGVQPIEAMLGIDLPAPDQAPDQAPAAPPATTTRAGRPLVLRPDALSLLADAAPGAAARREAFLAEQVAQHAPGVRLPLTLAGATPAVQRLLAPLGGDGPGALLSLQAGAGGDRAAVAAPPMVPGASLVVPLVLGDLELAAIGTCTETIDGRVFGFGHPLFGTGRASLPMAGGEIAAVMPLQTTSFKLGRVAGTVGTLLGDTPVGVAGRLGDAPEMAPVTLTVGERAFRFRVARERQVTGSLVMTTLVQALGVGGSPDPTAVLTWDLTLRFATGDGEIIELPLRDAASLQESGTLGLLLGVLGSVDAMHAVGDGATLLSGVDGRVAVASSEAIPPAAIVAAASDRAAYRAGERVRLAVTLERLDGARVTRAMSIDLPSELPAGEHALSVLPALPAASAALAERPALVGATAPREVAAQYAFLAEYSPQRLYARLALPTAALAVGDTLYRDLPPSQAGLLAGAGERADVEAVAPALVATADVPELVTRGFAEVVVRVVD